MSVKDFNQYIVDASKSNYIIPAFNVFGYEYAVGVIDVAEKMKSPVLFMVNRLAVNSMEIECWGSMLHHIARKANVCIEIHLDHMCEIDKIQRAIDSGFTSVMYDGSQLNIEENIENTRKVVQMARKSGVFVEAEIGSVPYDDMPGEIKDELTTATQAKYFADNSGCDWLAVAVGNIHRLVGRFAPIDFERLHSIGEKLDIPLVIHGATGITQADMKRLTATSVGKVNIGTSLRVAFVNALKDEINVSPGELDSIKLFKKPIEEISKVAQKKIAMLNSVNIIKE